MVTAMVTDRLILREYKETDKDAYFKLKSDKDTMYYLQDIQIFTQEEADEDFANVLTDMESKDRKYYFIYPQFWNKGYVTEAFKKVLEYAFTENHVYRVTTGCLNENIGSEKVMIKCGLIKEAEHIDWEWHDGKMKNRLEYRLLKREWECIDNK